MCRYNTKSVHIVQVVSISLIGIFATRFYVSLLSSDFRFVGTTCCKSISLVNLLIRCRKKLVQSL